MKIRSIHPGFFSDRKISNLPYEARVLYAGLWCYSDDYGRGQYLPKAIEGAVFPHDPVDIVDLLLKLEKAELIRVYEARGDVFYEIPSWDKYQSPRYKAKTAYPAPEDGEYRERPTNMHPGLFSTDSAQTQVRVSPDSLSGEGVGEGVGEGEGVLLAPQPARARDEIWDALLLAGFEAPTNDNTRGKRNKAVKLLRQSGATPEQISVRTQAWPLHFPDATLTDIALANHWDELGRPPAKASKAEVERFELERRMADDEHRARQLDRGLPE